MPVLIARTLSANATHRLDQMKGGRTSSTGSGRTLLKWAGAIRESCSGRPRRKSTSAEWKRMSYQWS
jgi:hypothetical protein